MTEEIEDFGHLPHASQVEAMAGYGLSAVEIGRLYRFDAELLKSTFAEELDAGEIKANASIAENLYRKAFGDGRESVRAAILARDTARWKETTGRCSRSTCPNRSLKRNCNSFSSKCVRAAGWHCCLMIEIYTG